MNAHFVIKVAQTAAVAFIEQSDLINSLLGECYDNMECKGLKQYCERGAAGAKDVLWAAFKNCPITCGLNCGKLRTKTTFLIFFTSFIQLFQCF